MIYQGLPIQLTDEYGAIVVYCKPELQGWIVTVEDYRAHVVERVDGDRAFYAAIFSRLRPKNYSVELGNFHDADVTVFPNNITEVDWRNEETPSRYLP